MLPHKEKQVWWWQQQECKLQILSKKLLKEVPILSHKVMKQLLPKAPLLQQILDLHGSQGNVLHPEDFLEED
jgi:growth differentiation factor 8/11